MRNLLAVASFAALAVSGLANAVVNDANWTEASPWVVNPGGGQHTGLAWAPDGSDRLFVIQKNGTVRVLRGALTSGGAGTWSTFANETVYTSSECGLIGIAFDPDFARNQYVYLFLTATSSKQQIVRYDASALTGTGRTVIVDNLPTAGQNHDGGAIGFGRDGKLYWAIGDLGNGTGVDDDLASLAAKVGRANRDGTPVGDNPFNDDAGPNNEYIWARGFRNPFTLTFQPSTGALWLNVVGTNYEQIFLVESRNHGGYNDYENNQSASNDYITPRIVYRTNGSDTRNLTNAVRAGNIVTFTTAAAHRFRVGGNLTIQGAADASFNMAPAYVTSVPSANTFTIAQPGPDAQSAGGSAITLDQGGSLTGGTFYDATLATPEYRGNFFYGDYNAGRIMRAQLDAGSNQVQKVDIWASGSATQVDIAVGPDGNLYYTGVSTGAISRAVFNPTLQGIVVANQHLRIDEAGAAVTTVRLARMPAADLVVTVQRSAGDADIAVETGATLTFTPDNWARPQPLRLTAAGDADLVDDAATITLSATGLDAVPIEVTTLDLGDLQPPVDLIFADGFED